MNIHINNNKMSKMKRTCSVILFFSFVACTNNPNKFPDESKKVNIQDSSSLKTNLIGRWGGFNESSPIWNFTTDSVYYFEENRNYRYILKDDALTVFYKEGPFVLKNVNIKGDTLFYTDNIGIVKAFRFK
jgi:hypothetical protein